MVCHWPGMYYNGTEHGFNVFKTVVERLHRRFNHLHWMKLSEIARYWAAKELTSIQGSKGNYSFTAPYACPDFTVSIPGSDVAKVQINDGTQLEPVSKRSGLKSGTYFKSNDGVLACFDMRKGTSQLSAR
jgi:hypothetical protein